MITSYVKQIQDSCKVRVAHFSYRSISANLFTSLNSDQVNSKTQSTRAMNLFFMKIQWKCVEKPMNPVFMAMKTVISDFMVLTEVMIEISMKFLTGYFHESWKVYKATNIDFHGSWKSHIVIVRSALVQICERPSLVSSVGFHKRMMSRSPGSLICDSFALRSSISDLFAFWWGILSHFFDHSSIDSNQFKQEDATAFV